jgi:hypothetical protein
VRTDRRGLLRTTGAVLGGGLALSRRSDAVRAANVRLVDADPGSGFNYPYFLYVPSRVRSDAPIVVQPNDTPEGTSDEFAVHLEGARGTMRGFPLAIADELNVPALVPVFPRPESDPVDWRHYTHQLDRDTLLIDDGPLERIDLQLLAMVDHAAARVEAETGAAVDEEILLNGFSSSGHFADRFTVLHAERVRSVTAGGLNGMALLPLTEAKGRTLRYQVGIADVESLTGESVDLSALSETNQFLYMGAEDTNDTLPYDDAWTSDALRDTARHVYGDDMVTERFPFCQTAYERAGVEAQFRVYEDLGHEYAPEHEIVEFHRRSLTGADVSMYGHDLREGPAGPVGVPGGGISGEVAGGMAAVTGAGVGMWALLYYLYRRSDT